MRERLRQLSYEELAPEVKPLADDILKVSSAALGGPYNALLRSPDMARRCFDLLDYLRFKTSVNKRLNEFAILIQARLSNAQYEWWAHEPIARRAGLSEAVMADLRACRRPAAMQEDERLVFDFCIQLSLNHRVPDAVWQALVDRMGEQVAVDAGPATDLGVLVITREDLDEVQHELVRFPDADALFERGLRAVQDRQDPVFGQGDPARRFDLALIE
mgnify:CR=1 FL=1